LPLLVIVDQCLNVSLQEFSRDTHQNPLESEMRVAVSG
jgi:hypothetical protein